MQAAYGVNLISFGGVKGTGSGQTIAIVDAYNDPTIVADANTFSSTFGLPGFNNPNGPTLQVLNETGGTSLANVPNATPGTWDVEEALDVEWAHAIAPLANIILFEANSNSLTDLLTAEQTAAAVPGVSVVSSSWTTAEFSGETSDDSYFTTPAGHGGVTFLASSGDSPAPFYPAVSPNVVAVGGTTLDVDSNGTYLCEGGWGNPYSGSGYGWSRYELAPGYQIGRNNFVAGYRSEPDVSMDGDPNSGVDVVDSYDLGGAPGTFLQVGGTSLACPMMGGLVAIANQGRALVGLSSLDGAHQTLPVLYGLPTSDYHFPIDVWNSPNLLGYNLPSGLGSPVANDVVQALVGNNSSVAPTTNAPTSEIASEGGSYAFPAGALNVSDPNASGTSDSVTLAAQFGTISLGSSNGLTIVASGPSSMTVNGTLANLNAALSSLVYTPNSNFSGDDLLEISDNNAIDGQSSFAGVLLTVNGEVWLVSAPTSVALSENQGAYSFSNAISMTDPYSNVLPDQVSLSASDGLLTLGSTAGLVFTSGANGSTSMTVQGSVANLNSALDSLAYTPNPGYVGADTLDISALTTRYNVSATAPVAITISPMAPTITAPASVSVNENYSLTLNGANAISAADPGGTSERFVLSVQAGTLNLGTTSGLTVTGNGSSSITASGSLASLDADLATLVYTPSANNSGSDTLSLSDIDIADNLTTKSSVSITVVGSLAVTVPATMNADENAPLPLSGVDAISVSDSGGATDQLTLTVVDGTLNFGSIAGLSVAGNGTSSVTASGPVSSLNADLSTVTYTPNPAFVGSDALSISVSDAGSGLTGQASSTIAVLAWTAMKNTVPNSDGAGVSLLLPNGTLMVKGGGDTDTAVWYQVTPDATGSYVNGTWTQLASMNVSRLFFGSDVLPSGNVFVVGGLYAGDQSASTSAEIYNPRTNTWTQVASDPVAQVGNQPTEVLANGSVMVSTLARSQGWAPDGETEIYNPATNSWSQAGNAIFTDQTNADPWVKLPNGELLTYDGLTSSQDNQGQAKFFDPSSTYWFKASYGTLPVLTNASANYGVGPELLLPDGRVFIGGGNGLTAFYNSGTGLWSQGPTMPSVLVNGVPTQLTMNASPGAVMPNGDLLLALAPAVNGNSYAGPTFLYDFNPATGVYTNVTPPASSGFDTSNHSFVDNMLVLPTGQVLVTNFEGTPFIYTPQGTPNSAWKPSIISFTNNGNGSYTLSGTQLNGRDEGASDGGDGQMAENYPLVRVTDTLTGAVYYATTSNWSSTGVATGSATETVSVVLPTALGNDPYSLVVIADGIASSAYSGQNGTASTARPIGPANPYVEHPELLFLNPPGAVTFSGNNALAIQDAYATSDEVFIWAAEGIFTLATTTGLTVTGNGTSYLALSGTLSSINADLPSLTYTMSAPYSTNPSYLGDYFFMDVKDSEDGAVGEGAFEILKSYPSVSSSALATVGENRTAVFAPGTTDSITLTDAWSPASSDTLSLKASDGKMTLASTAGLTFKGGSNSSSSMTLSGTIAALDAAVAGLTYTPSPGFSGFDLLQISLSDPSTVFLFPSEAQDISIDVVPPPSITAPASCTVNENSSTQFGPGQIAAADTYAPGATESLTLTVAHGTLSLSSYAGLTVTGNGTSSIAATGLLSNLNAALGGLIYAPSTGFSGGDSLQIAVTDPIDNTTGSATVAISVDAPPSIQAPSAVSMNENGTDRFAGSITLTDAAASGMSDSLTLSVSHGTLTLGSTSGLSFAPGANGSSSMIVTGTIANLNAALNGLVYAPTQLYAGSDSLLISVTDALDGLTGSGHVALTINAQSPPVVTAPSSVSLKENSSYAFAASAISLSDATASGASDSLTLSVSFGKLTLGSTMGLTFTSGANNSSSMTVTGPLANLNAAVSGLLDTPTAGFSGHDTLAISLADAIDKSVGSASVAIAVDPYITAPATAIVLANASFTFSTALNTVISATDGAASGTSDSLTLTVSHGKLTLGSLTGLTIISGANSSSSMTVQGTLANLNAALNGLMYVPTSGFTGSDTLAVTVNNSIDGLSGSATVAITVQQRTIRFGVAMAPPVTAPSSSIPDDQADQWTGVAAAVDTLYE
jgi:hypothetical protein